MKTSYTYLVGIGASAGGLEALQAFFGALPSNTGMAFVVIQHLSPDFKSLMGELLGKNTNMAIEVIDAPKDIQGNHVYLIDRGTNVGIVDGKLSPIEKDVQLRINLPIDIFFHELGRYAGDRAVGVVFSGTGTDGSRGIKTIKEQGGLVFVQSPETAKFNGMPNASLRLGLADFVLPPAEIANRLAMVAQQPASGGQALADLLANAHEIADPDNLLEEILGRVRDHSGLGFEQYREKTLLRRIEKRMTLHGTASMLEYYRYMLANPQEIDALSQDFLIGVTRFFRDSDAWHILNQHVIYPLLEKLEEGRPVRIWSAGCSTGEEAYSLAFLLQEASGHLNLNIDFKIFASDIDKKAIEFAGAGLYAINAVADVPSYMLERYFVKQDNLFSVKKSIRDRIVFAVHDLLNDPPFINMDMVVCRNLLIYIRTTVQKRLLANFQFALRHKGVLFLGSSESISGFEEVFVPIDKHFNIYESVMKGRLAPLKQARMAKAQPAKMLSDDAKSLSKEKNDLLQIADSHALFTKMIVKECVDDLVLFTTGAFELLYVQGDASKILRLNGLVGGGKADLLEMLDEAERAIFRNGIRQAIKGNKGSRFFNVSFRRNKKSYAFNIVFKPIWLEIAQAKIAMIVISSVAKSIAFHENGMDGQQLDTMKAMEIDLQETKYELNRVKQELETSNEELQASNEELLGANEELQSNNEELQSVNEELYTVNSEFQGKIAELTQLNNDVNNLFNGLEVAVIFLDKALNIRKITPSVTQIFNISEQDVGRPVHFFTNNVNVQHIHELAAKVARTLQPHEQKAYTRDGHTFLMRIFPYRTQDGVIDGVLLTFADISELEKVHARLEQSELLLKEAANIAAFGAWELSDGTVLWSEGCAGLHGQRQAIALSIAQMCGFYKEEYRSMLASRMQSLQDSLIPFSMEVKLHDKDVWMLIQGSFRKRGKKATCYGVCRDITKERLALGIAKDRELKLKAFFDSSNSFHFLLDREYRILAFNKKGADQAEKVWGRKPKEGDDMRNFSTTADLTDFQMHFSEALSGRAVRVERAIAYPAVTVWYEVTYLPVFDDAGQVFAVSFNATDISEQKNAEQSLRFKGDILTRVHDAIIVTDMKGLITFYNEGAERVYGYTADEMLGASPSVLYPDQDMQDFQKDLAKIIAGAEYVGEWEGRTKAGDAVWVEVKTTLLFDEKGEPQGFIGVSRDITQAKSVANELLAQKSLLQSVIDASSDSIVLTDLEGGILTTNKRILPVIDGGGNAITDRISEEARVALALEGMIDKVVGAGKAQTKYLEQRGRHYDFTLYPVKGMNGKVERIAFYVKDITEQTQNAQQILDLSERFSLATRNAKVGIWDFHVRQNLLIWDELLCEIHGIGKGEFGGDYRSWSNCIHAEDRSHADSTFNEAIRMRRPFNAIYRVLMADGSLRYIQSIGELQESHGEPRMLGASWDVTGEILSKERIEESRKRLQLILESISFPFIIVKKADSEVLYANAHVAQLFDERLEDILGKPERVLYKNDASKAAFLEQLLAANRIDNYQITVHSKAGKPLHLLVSARLVNFEGQQAIFINFHDISALRKAQEEINMLALVVKETDNLVIITDKGGYTEWVNEGFTRTTGYSLQDMLGKKPGALLQGEKTDPSTVARMRKAVHGGEAISIEILNYTKDQRPYWIASDIQPIRNEQGELLKFIAVQRDITERKKFEETLSAQNEELKKANQELDNFVYRVSHDLRAPLATMGELLEVMKEEFKGNEDVLLYVGLQEQSLRKQDNFIRDILDYSRNARLPIKKVLVDIAQEAVGMYATLPRLGDYAKPLLTVEAEPFEWPLDAARFRVIMQNLLGNAIRYADYTKPAQWIKLTASTDGGALSLTVEDNGIGIKKEHLPKIFDMFYRATAKHTGSGLGLYIVKEALDRLSGTISVDSEFGQGTKFTMRIP